MRQSAHHPPPPRLQRPPLPAPHRRERLPPLRVRLRVDQVAERLHLGQIHTPVGVRLPRELARLGQPVVREAAERLERRADDGGRAVRVQLDGVLAGEGARARQPQHKRLVNQLALPCLAASASAEDVAREGPEAAAQRRGPRCSDVSRIGKLESSAALHAPCAAAAAEGGGATGRPAIAAALGSRPNLRARSFPKRCCGPSARTVGQLTRQCPVPPHTLQA
mmetsp:Transcript_16798/g.54519  ORF Transcript_16798/g.54519 Transcript_16798/m.54519 type:complete len:222 (-) Transcript_16798:295-960(-)